MHTSSSGGTHAGLVAGRALLRSLGEDDLPPILAIGVAKGVNAGFPDVAQLAIETLELIGARDVEVMDDDVELDRRWMGPDYAVPTAAGAEAARWAAVHGGWVLDDTYTAKGFAGLLGNAATGRWRPGTDVRVPAHRRAARRVRLITRLPCRGSRRTGAGRRSRKPTAAARRPSAGRSSARTSAPNERVPVARVAGPVGGPRTDVEVRRGLDLVAG